jgi:hypothetical protein
MPIDRYIIQKQELKSRSFKGVDPTWIDVATVPADAPMDIAALQKHGLGVYRYIKVSDTYEVRTKVEVVKLGTPSIRYSEEED